MLTVKSGYHGGSLKCSTIHPSAGQYVAVPATPCQAQQGCSSGASVAGACIAGTASGIPELACSSADVGYCEFWGDLTESTPRSTRSPTNPHRHTCSPQWRCGNQHGVYLRQRQRADNRWAGHMPMCGRLRGRAVFLGRRVDHHRLPWHAGRYQRMVGRVVDVHHAHL